MESKEQIEKTIEEIDYKSQSEAGLQVQIEHALHHLYFAWNVRHVPIKEYRKMGHENFNKWSKVPRELWVANIPSPRKRSSAKKQKKK